MKGVARRKPPAKKKKKNPNIKSWVVVIKGDYINAAIDNHINTVEKLEAMGYTVAGTPAFVEKEDAIEYCKFYLLQTTGKKYRREPKK
jgi:queuine/archaeosine tRNA-ribosyltransferase